MHQCRYASVAATRAVSPSEALNAAALVGVVFTVTTTAAVMALTVTVIV